MPNVGAQVERRNFNSLYPGLNLPKAKKRGPANLGRQSDLEYAKQNQQREAEYNKQSMTGIDQAHANSLSQPNRLSDFDQQLEAQKQLKQNKADTNSSGNTSEKVAGEKTGGTNKKNATPANKTGGSSGSTIKNVKNAVGGAKDALASGVSETNRWWIKACITTSFDITGILGIPAILYLCLHKFVLAKINKSSLIFLKFTNKENLFFWTSFLMWSLIALVILILIMGIMGLIKTFRLDEIQAIYHNPVRSIEDFYYGVFGESIEGNTYSPFQIGGWTPFDWSD
ncbi:MAG: hypothetical protein ABIE68_00430 [bacterium]